MLDDFKTELRRIGAGAPFEDETMGMHFPEAQHIEYRA